MQASGNESGTHVYPHVVERHELQSVFEVSALMSLIGSWNALLMASQRKGQARRRLVPEHATSVRVKSPLGLIVVALCVHCSCGALSQLPCVAPIVFQPKTQCVASLMRWFAVHCAPTSTQTGLRSDSLLVASCCGSTASARAGVGKIGIANSDIDRLASKLA